MVIVAGGMFAYMLMLGLIADGGNLFQNKQSVQNAADAAAMAAAQAVVNPQYYCAADPDVTSAVARCAGSMPAATALAARTATPPRRPLPRSPRALHSSRLTLSPTHSPRPQATPAPGCYVYPYKGNAGEVEVWLTRNTSNFFGKLLGIGTSSESARAVASLVAGGPPPPFSFATLQSDGEKHTLLIQNGSTLHVTASMDADSCDQSANCQPPNHVHDAFDVFGAGGTITDDHDIEVVGGWETKNNSPVGANGGTCVNNFMSDK
jgi:hypothetical protein